MHTGVRAPPSRNPDLSVHNRRITYLLGPYPGGPRHDGIDYANSRNRPSWPKPPWNYASTPSDSASLSPSLSVFSSSLLSLSFFQSTLSSPLSFPSSSLSLPLFALHAFFSSFFKLIHPLLSFLEHQELLSFYRVDDPPSSAPFFFSLSPSYPYSRAYYVTRITIICFETASTAHQSE